jgi:predicted amidohydrolase
LSWPTRDHPARRVARIFLALVAGLTWLIPGAAAPAQDQSEESRPRVISTVCLLDGAAYQNKGHVLDMLGRVEKSRRESLIVTPFLPFLSFEEGKEKAALQEFFDVARSRKAYLVIALVERASSGKTYHTALVIGPSGEIAGRYRQTHHAAWDETFALGDDLPVIATPFAKIGLTIGSDFYFPEVYEVLRMKGAEVLVWQNSPQRLREHYQWLPLLAARAVDSHAFLVTAHYADPRTYITANYGAGMRGAAFGRSMVIDRSGTIRADTGYRHGVAALAFDLDERKVDVYSMTPNFENLFYVPNNGGRAAFKLVAEPWAKPKLPEFKKRTARIAVATTSGDDMWKDGAYPKVIFELLGRAWEFKPDLVLFSENGVKNPKDPEVKRGLDDISRWAAAHRCYVVIGGIGDEKYKNGAARLWDRSGRLAYSAPLYWPAGAEGFNVYDTDFARIAAAECGDLYQFPIDRTLALKGAELILDPSQMWGPDGYHNELLQRARAIDNGCYRASAHWNTSDPGLRSTIVDPYGGLIASSEYQTKGVIFADIDFSVQKVYYTGLNPKQPQAGAQDIPNYYTPDLPQAVGGWRDMIFGNRRPELYGLIPTENEITRRYISKELQKRQNSKEAK